MTNHEPHNGTNSGPHAGTGNGAHSSLRIVEWEPGGTHMFTTGDSEWIVLPLNGGCTVDIENEKYQLLGRDSVFSGVTDFAYVPRDARAQIASGAGGRFALAGAKCERRLPARYGPAPEVFVDEPLRPRHVLRHPPHGRASRLQRGRHWLWRAVCVQCRARKARTRPDGRRRRFRNGVDHLRCGAGRRVIGGGGAVQEWRICFHPDHAEGTGGYR